jgi:hypothetical protein
MAFKEVYFKRKENEMKTNFKLLLNVFVVLISTTTVFAQSQAREFIESQNDTTLRQVVYLSCTNDLIKTNDKIQEMQGFSSLDKDVQDTLIKKYTLILNDVKDDSIISTFKSEIIDQMTYLGFKVIPTNKEDFPKVLKNNESTLDIAQLELEEYSDIDSIMSENTSNERVYHLRLDGIKVNAWLIYNENDTNSKEVFFCDESMRDYFEGYIEQEAANRYFANYSITKINPNDAYLTSFQSATTAANYFYNFLMNRYVWIKTNGMDKNYYGISSDKTLITKSSPFDNFDIIKQ